MKSIDYKAFYESFCLTEIQSSNKMMSLLEDLHKAFSITDNIEIWVDKMLCLSESNRIVEILKLAHAHQIDFYSRVNNLAKLLAIEQPQGVTTFLAEIEKNKVVYVKHAIYTYIGTDVSGLFKIGRTNNLKKRSSEICTGNVSFEMLYFVAGDFEKRIHLELAPFRVRREFFALTDLQLMELVKSYSFTSLITAQLEV